MWSWLTATDNRHLTETAKFGYIPGLDGIRALAVLIVMVAHLGFEHIVPGGFGVTVFFFISGFLITRLLLAESEKSGIGLKNFYMRRFVRLYPALLFMIFGTVAIYGLGGIGGPTGTELTAGIFYFTNTFQVFIRTTTDSLPFMPWTHLWSLAVEEHFYLIFPLFMVLCRKNWKRAAVILIALLAVVPLWRTFIMFGTNLPYADYNYMMTDARFDSLAWGCLLSVLLHLKGVSYALYLWHVPIYDLVHRSMERGPISLLITTVASFAIAAISFYVVEKPFVALRKRFGAHVVKREKLPTAPKAKITVTE